MRIPRKHINEMEEALWWLASDAREWESRHGDDDREDDQAPVFSIAKDSDFPEGMHSCLWQIAMIAEQRASAAENLNDMQTKFFELGFASAAWELMVAFDLIGGHLADADPITLDNWSEIEIVVDGVLPHDFTTVEEDPICGGD